MKATVDATKKIKVSGYIQAQYQTAETAGITSFAGGNFPSNVQSRFQVRRGRVKVNYDNDLTQYVLQIDVTQNGVAIKDVYASLREPWWQTFGLTAGIFNRPFGFEIGYSSSSRESPERSRVIQTLFPGERELGAMVSITTAKIEELIYELKQNYTIVIVTHNMQQAARVSDYTAFFYLGELIEYDETKKIFTTPLKKQTEDYITGRFG